MIVYGSRLCRVSSLHISSTDMVAETEAGGVATEHQLAQKATSKDR